MNKNVPWENVQCVKHSIREKDRLQINAGKANQVITRALIRHAKKIGCYNEAKGNLDKLIEWHYVLETTQGVKSNRKSKDYRDMTGLGKL